MCSTPDNDREWNPAQTPENTSRDANDQPGVNSMPEGAPDNREGASGRSNEQPKTPAGRNVETGVENKPK